MKTLFTTILLFIGFVTLAQPQHERMKREKRMENIKNMTPEQQATLWSKKMTLELDLNASQQEEIYTLILEKAKRNKMHQKNNVKKSLSNDERFKMQENLLDEKIKMRNAMKSILNPDQYEQWKKIEKQKERKKRKHSKMKKEKR
jgi:periplasmic protein CpxP/Spy